MEEGIATYVESIARCQQRAIRATEVWTRFVSGMPNGQPVEGDRGLDRTPTWGRTYWGGALFCLVADVQIRKATANTRGLRDALRGILAAGGSMNVRWNIGRALAAGDRATGTDVLQELYGAWAEQPVTVDLAALWSELGVRIDGQTRVSLDDDAPNAGIRRSARASPPYPAR